MRKNNSNRKSNFLRFIKIELFYNPLVPFVCMHSIFYFLHCPVLFLEREREKREERREKRRREREEKGLSEKKMKNKK